MVRAFSCPLLVKTKTLMKRTLWYLIGLGIFIGLGYLLATKSNDVTVNNTATSQIEVVKPPSSEERLEQATQAMIAEAIAAKQANIDAAKEAAAQKVEGTMKLDIEREVRQRLSTTNKERIVEIEKETKVY